MYLLKAIQASKADSDLHLKRWRGRDSTIVAAMQLLVCLCHRLIHWQLFCC